MDTIAQMLTEIRNAQMAGHNEVKIQSSKLKVAIANILKSEGFVDDVRIDSGEKGDSMHIKLKYLDISRSKKTPAIKGIKKVSKSGQRIYIKKTEIRNVKGKFGVGIISTSKGVMTNDEAVKSGLGGEYICEVW
jgi:small subunit ribosomal protein S8